MFHFILKVVRKLSMFSLYLIFHDKSKYLSWYGLFTVGYKLNLKNPKTLNEKINWYKLNYNDPLMVKVTDKYQVDEYLKEKGLDQIVIPKYHVFDSVDEIKYEDLPSKFVMKSNADSGGVWVCNNLTQESFKNGIRKIKKSLKQDFSKYTVEWNYKDIPKKIIVEQLIETNDSKPPIDYKFFCFHGEPKFLFVATDRPIDTRFDFFDMNWNKLNVSNHYKNSTKVIEKPKKFDEMIEICKVLSSDFPHVRVDLYYENDQIYFGELTFFHFSGFQPFKPKKWDYIFGEYFDINRMNTSNRSS